VVFAQHGVGGIRAIHVVPHLVLAVGAALDNGIISGFERLGDGFDHWDDEWSNESHDKESDSLHDCVDNLLQAWDFGDDILNHANNCIAVCQPKFNTDDVLTERQESGKSS
jgi:hypothetical protein